MIGRRELLIGVGVALVGGGTFAGSSLASPDGSGPASPTDGDDGDPVGSDSAFGVVERRTLTEAKDYSANVQYGDPYDLPLDRTGTVTSGPAVDVVIGFGEEIVRVDLQPTFLAEGSLPMYRELRREPDRKVAGKSVMVGYDVGQLQRFLIAAEFDEDGDLSEVDGEFGSATQRAVKAWQKAVGNGVTGRVDSTQLIFSPAPVRIDEAPRLGAAFSTIRVTETTQRIEFAVQSRDRRLVEEGGSVSIALPDGTDVTGSIAELRRGVSDDGQGTLTAKVVPDEPIASDVSAVQVTVTRSLASDVLAVPVRALLAIRDGGFAVERSTARADGAPDLVAVEVGAVADGWVEVTGDIAEGDRLVVAQ